MRSIGLLVAVAQWLRSYLVATLLVIGLAVSCVRTWARDIEPRPQHPPSAYTLSRTRTQLQWSLGNREGPVQLQVSKDERFTDLFVDEPARGTTRNLKRLEPGQTYHWRLVQGDRTSTSSSFRVSSSALRFR